MCVLFLDIFEKIFKNQINTKQYCENSSQPNDYHVALSMSPSCLHAGDMEDAEGHSLKPTQSHHKPPGQIVASPPDRLQLAQHQYYCYI